MLSQCCGATATTGKYLRIQYSHPDNVTEGVSENVIFYFVVGCFYVSAYLNSKYAHITH